MNNVKAIKDDGSHEICHSDETATVASPQPLSLLERAIDRGLDVDALIKLADLEERRREADAERAFISAKSAALGEMPVIPKDARLPNSSKSYATLASIHRTARPILARHGLDFDWRTEQADGRVTVTCHLSHRDGHSRTNWLSAKVQGPPGTSEAQQVAGTTYILERHTVCIALGIATETDEDVFERGGGAGIDAFDPEPVKTAIEMANHIAELRQIGAELGRGGGDRFEKIPNHALPNLRHAWRKRMQELGAANNREAADV